jgi:hypothetical protein
MTSTAAATHTLRTPRRRTKGPAAWELVGAISGAVAATALVVATCILSSTPSVNSTPAAVRDYLANHYTVTTAAACTTVIAALLLVPFLASLRSFTSRRTDAGQWRLMLTLVVGAIGVAMLSLTGALLATATLLAHRSSADEAVFAVFVAAKLLATLALLPVATLVLANARTIATTNQRPHRWLVRFDIQIAVIAVVMSIASFVDHDWLAPGQQATATAWLLVALWVFALARTIASGHGRHSTSEEGTP